MEFSGAVSELTSLSQGSPCTKGNASVNPCKYAGGEGGGGDGVVVDNLQ